MIRQNRLSEIVVYGKVKLKCLDMLGPTNCSNLQYIGGEDIVN